MSPCRNAPRIPSAEHAKRTLLVQKGTVEETYRLFGRSRDVQRVSVVYWYGVECLRSGTSAVLSVGAPRAECTVVDYHVKEAEAARLGHAMRLQSLVSLAQLYTLPSGGGRHTKNDDVNAISLREGFLSLAAPYYGQGTEPLLGNTTVHERRDGGWRVLGEAEIAGRIRIVDGLVDLEGC